ncbi:MAG: hypothetical protein JOZ87_37320 [Chloroflexi bacterium]|nr:hypothetical protein [Chloroflexota bacterium]
MHNITTRLSHIGFSDMPIAPRRAAGIVPSVLAAAALLFPGASASALAAPAAPPGSTLQLVSAYQGLIDTQEGSTWSSGANAPFAEPTIARGEGGDQLQMAADWNFGRLFGPAGGTDHYGNFNDSLGDWAGGALPQNEGFSVAQPQLLHDLDDRGFDRYLLAASATSWSTHQSKIAIAVNKYLGDVDYGNTCVQSLDANFLPGASPTNFYVDELRIGNTDNGIVMAGNMYGFDDNQFKYSKVWVLPKSELYNGYMQDCPLVQHAYFDWSLTNPDGSLATSVVPAHSYVGGYVADMINTEAPGDNGSSSMTLWHVNTQYLDSGSVSFDGVAVNTNAYFNPPNASQAGTNVQINTWDSRVYNAVLQPGALWTVHTVACIGSSDPNTWISCLDWLEIDPNSGAVRQEGMYGYDGAYMFAPAITADGDGNAVLAFEASAAYANVGVYFTGRQSSDAPNTLRDLQLLKDGEGCYEREPSNTVGMHSAVDMDPRDGGLFFIDGAYTTGSDPNCQKNDWATRYGVVSFSGPASAAQLATGSTVARNTANAVSQKSITGAHHPVTASSNAKVNRPAKSTNHMPKQHAGPVATRSNPGAPVVHRSK